MDKTVRQPWAKYVTRTVSRVVDFGNHSTLFSLLTSLWVTNCYLYIISNIYIYIIKYPGIIFDIYATNKLYIFKNIFN